MATHELSESYKTLNEVPVEDILKSIRKTGIEQDKPCYFNDQIRLSREIVDRIRLILKKNQKTLEDFTDFDFQIYTARFTTLENQTRHRLEDQLSECIPPKLYNGPAQKLHAYTKERVSLYDLRGEALARHTQLLNEANASPDKLFLIVADEAHWGIVADDANVNARKKLIDSWAKENHKNVIVLLVSATPYNLMEDKTHLLLNEWCARSLTTGELLSVQPKGDRLLNGEERDVTDYVGLKKRLYHIQWTEIMTAKLNETINQQEADKENKPKLHLVLRTLANNKSNKKNSNPVYLVPKPNCSDDFVPLIGVTDIENHMTDGTIMLDESRGKVRVFDSQSRQLVVKRSQGLSEYDVGFVRKDLIQEDCNLTRDFEIFMELGEDVFALFALEPGSGRKLSLYYNVTGGKIEAHQRPELKIRGIHQVLTQLPAEDLFFIHSISFKAGEHTGENTENAKRYLSLNFYHSTMWNENRKHQLIRHDSSFEYLCKVIGPTADNQRKTRQAKSESTGIHEEEDILIAEYCLFVATIVSFQKLEIPRCIKSQEERKTFFEKVRKCTKEINIKLVKIANELPDMPTANKIGRKTFVDVLATYHSQLGQPQGIWDHLFKACLLGDVKTADETLKTKEFRAESITSENLKEAKQSAIDTYETAKIVQNLLNIPNGESVGGRMTVIRVPSIENGNRFYETLTLALKVACHDLEFYPFTLVRDFGTSKLSDFIEKADRKQFKACLLIQKSKCNAKQCPCDKYEPKREEHSAQCKKCGHHHNSLETFEDLNGMPCILILVEKGKMGDTLPDSFKCLDLRVRSPKQMVLSTAVQGLGRLCKYTQEKKLHQMPYALVKRETVDSLKRGQGTIYSCFVEGGQPDRHGSYEIQNIEELTRRLENITINDKAHNMMLLDAEPQCGKTGTFCHVISTLRKIISGNVDDTDIEMGGDDSDEEDTEVDDEERWQYPYWKDMEKSQMKLKITSYHKYAAAFGIWKPGQKAQTQPTLEFHTSRNPKKGGGTNKHRESFSTKIYKAESYGHYQNCDQCLSTHAPEPMKHKDLLLGDLGPYKIYIPQHQHYLDLQRKIEDPDCSMTGNDLTTWIFVPSSKRAKHGCFNLYHTMQGPKGETKSYLQIIVVQPQEYEQYLKHWGCDIAIMVLPSKMKDEAGQEISCSEGGIGYSRRFIQEFALHHNLPHIFMLDDNVYYVLEAQFHQGKVSRTEGSRIKFDEVPLFKVLKHLEAQFDPREKAPAKCFEPHSAIDSRDSLESYCGPHSQYGMVGVRKIRPGSTRVRSPFKKGHVHSFVLLNLEAVGRKVLYDSVRVYEDLRFNEGCNGQGLWVAKFNRFQMAKKKMPSNPLVYVWTENSELQQDDANLHQPLEEVEVKIIKSWIAHFMAPAAKYLRTDGGTGARSSPQEQQLSKLFNEVNIIANGTDVHFVCLNQAPGPTLTKHLTETPGIGGYNLHLIAISADACRDNKLRKMEDFRSLCNGLFHDPFQMNVFTSHTVEEFAVTIVVIVIKGDIRNPVDHEKCRTESPVRMKKPPGGASPKTKPRGPDKSPSERVPLGPSPLTWCKCKRCPHTGPAVKTQCCQDIKQIKEMTGKYPEVECLTQHPGFKDVCLNEHVLLAAFNAHKMYQHHYEDTDSRTMGDTARRQLQVWCYDSRTMGDTARRQLQVWCYDPQKSDKQNLIPACVELAIRKKYPASNEPNQPEV